MWWGRDTTRAGCYPPSNGKSPKTLDRENMILFAFPPADSALHELKCAEVEVRSLVRRPLWDAWGPRMRW